MSGPMTPEEKEYWKNYTKRKKEENKAKQKKENEASVKRTLDNLAVGISNFVKKRKCYKCGKKNPIHTVTIKHPTRNWRKIYCLDCASKSKEVRK